MGRPARNSQGGYVYHVLQRGCKVKPIFRTDEDYIEFISILGEMYERFEPRILSYTLLPKLWHLIVVPRRDGDLSKLIAWTSVTHSSRWHTKPRRTGTGSIYVPRFKSFPIQDNERLLEVMHYIESLKPIKGDSAWRWTSGFARNSSPANPHDWLSSPPIALPDDWTERISQPLTDDVLIKIEQSIEKGTPYGNPDWIVKTANRMGLISTTRPRGRPKRSD